MGSQQDPRKLTGLGIFIDNEHALAGGNPFRCGGLTRRARPNAAADS